MTARRFPFAALAAALGLSENQAIMRLSISGKSGQLYRHEGMSEKVADRMAVRAGLHPFEVWPEMANAAIEDVDRKDAARLEERQQASRENWRRANAKKRATNPDKERARQVRWRAESKRAIAIYKRQWDLDNKDRVAANSRAYRARKRAERQGASGTVAA